LNIVKGLGTTSVFVAALVLTNYDHAFAYIDPASGSYVLQSLLAVLLGGVFAVDINTH